MVRQADVVGRVFFIPPIKRISCSLFRLWMIAPEHRNNKALKNAWVQMWRNASWGRLSPMVTIIKPSWLDVENAMIFLMSFWVIAHTAVKVVVSAPIHRHVVSARLLFSRSGDSRISRKMPATTIVLECSRADTGVGPSMAAGNHGCRPNCADLPAAARIRPNSGRMSGDCCWAKICVSSHVEVFVADQAKVKIRPMSPIRL